MEGNGAARHWRGVALGLIFLALGSIPAIFFGWQTTSYVLAVGGLFLAVGELMWIIWSRRRLLHGAGEGADPDDKKRP
ncbi:hypothetical protein KNO15_19550 [Leifsonia shinshuensis]|uniref:hypothetical protein n=1 Tax=Leifsonia shinshuensis TaxID=150026 RepID=UPI001F506789|nr:hypothetical protein [Leifsonia shinshuensis]MCI0158903.1 hypothetical protein [Leifsonia shinshuensis]